MKLIDFLKSLFASFFQKKQEKRLELPLNELQSFIDENKQKPLKELELKANSLLSEIKFLLKDAESKLKELKNEKITEEEGSTRLRRIVNTSKRDLEAKLSYLLTKLALPKSNDLFSLREYAFSASTILQREIIIFRKNIAYTSVLLKNVMRDLGKTFEELNEKLNTLMLLFKEKEFLLMLESNEILKLINEKKESIDSFNNKINELSESISLDKQELELLEEKLSRLSASPSFAQLTNLEKEKESVEAELSSLKDKANQLFFFLERPLKKLAKAKPELFDDELNSFIDLLFARPLNAIKSDSKNEKIRKIFSLLKENLDLITFDLKEKEKLQARILSLENKDFFSEFFWLENELKRKISELNKSISLYKEKDELNSLKIKIAEAQSRLSTKATEIPKLENLKTKTQQDFNNLVSGLENDLEKAFGFKVNIKAF